MKILIYTHEYKPFIGGVAIYNDELAKGLAKLGQDVIVLAPRYSKEDKLNDRKRDFQVVRMSELKSAFIRKIPELEFLLGAFYFMISLIRYRPDKILFTNEKSQIVGAIFSLLLPIRFFITVHGSEVLLFKSSRGIKGGIRRFILRKFYGSADKIISVSSSTKKLLEEKIGVRPDRIRVIYPGIDIDRFSIKGNPEKLRQQFGLTGKKVILTVARLDSRKGQDKVIEALPKVIKDIPEVKYLIVGEGYYRGELEKLAQKYGVEESVIFTGTIPDDNDLIIDYYDLADVFIMPSRTQKGKIEGLGISFLEASARGKAIIAGKSGGSVEAVRDGETGLLVDPNDSEKIAGVILDLLKNDEKSRTFGTNARRRAEELFTSRVMAIKTLRVLKGEW